MITKEETDAYNLRESLYDNIYAPYSFRPECQWAAWYCDGLSDEMEREIRKRISDEMIVTWWDAFGYGGDSTLFITTGTQVSIERFNLYVDKCNRFYNRRNKEENR